MDSKEWHDYFKLEKSTSFVKFILSGKLAMLDSVLEDSCRSLIGEDKYNPGFSLRNSIKNADDLDIVMSLDSETLLYVILVSQMAERDCIKTFNLLIKNFGDVKTLTSLVKENAKDSKIYKEFILESQNIILKECIPKIHD